jgi:hypothetical protein
MVFALLYALLRQLVGLPRSDSIDEFEIEVVVLRHQVNVLCRAPAPRAPGRAWTRPARRASP